MTTLTERARRLKPPTTAVRLPPLLLMTDSARLADPSALIDRLPRGSAVILRNYDHPHRAALAQRLAVLCRRHHVRLLIAGDPLLARAVGAAGLHLSEAVLRHGDRRWHRWRLPGWTVTAAAHSPTALRLAAARGIDAALLSPVFVTASHPGAAPIGALRFVRWLRGSTLPVYALGGITAASARRLSGSGAVGLAMIGGWLPPSHSSRR